MRFALDSNILVYGFIRDDESKHEIAVRILTESPKADAVLPAQVLGEFLNAIRRKHPEHFADAVLQAERWQATFATIPTTDDLVVAGARFASQYKLQLWDSIIWQVAKSARAAVLLTEDLQDGLQIDGMRVLNPFAHSNAQELTSLLMERRE